MRRRFWERLFFVLTVCCVPAAGTAQEDIAALGGLPHSQSGLVLFINSRLLGTAITLTGDKGETLSRTVWKSDLPFLREYRLAPRRYRVYLPGPISSIALSAEPGKLTFLKIERYAPPATDELGVQITVWHGHPTPEIKKILGALAAAKSAYLRPVPIESATLGLHVMPDPPWPIPPPPPQ